MSAKVEYSRRARLDLLEIGDHLERAAGKRTALKWVARLKSKARLLTDFPYVGAADAELGDRRRLVVRPYVIVYRVLTDEHARVIRILHGARDLPSLFELGDPD